MYSVPFPPHLKFAEECPEETPCPETVWRNLFILVRSSVGRVDGASCFRMELKFQPTSRMSKSRRDALHLLLQHLTDLPLICRSCAAIKCFQLCLEAECRQTYRRGSRWGEPVPGYVMFQVIKLGRGRPRTFPPSRTVLSVPQTACSSCGRLPEPLENLFRNCHLQQATTRFIYLVLIACVVLLSNGGLHIRENLEKPQPDVKHYNFERGFTDSRRGNMKQDLDLQNRVWDTHRSNLRTKGKEVSEQ